jgi:ADP-ribose pyrophosphatase
MSQEPQWKLVSNELLFETTSKGLRVQKRVYQSSEGKTKTVELKDEGPFGHVFGITPENKIILIRQFRVGPDKYFYESPAGSLDKGDNPQEEAARELREETGYTSSEITLLRAGFDTGYSTAMRYLYLAKNCVKSHEQELDDDEDIDGVILSSVDEVKEMIKNDEYLFPLLAYLAFEKIGILKWS